MTLDSLVAEAVDLPPRQAGTVQLLPTPPTDDELSMYECRDVGLLAGTSVVSIVCLTVSQVQFVHISYWFLLVVPFLVFSLGYYLLGLFITLSGRNFDMAAHRRLVADWAPVSYPSVDILLPVCNEGIDVLVNTWRHVRRLAEHYPGEVAVVVLDDGDSPAAAAAAREIGFDYTVRPNRGWFKKAGNLRHGYAHTYHDYLVVFDADFCPRLDFLHHLMPYHEADPGLGIVQSPQFFRHDRRQTWMERGAASVQELFYRMVQVSRDRRNGAICVGSCAVYRRTALDAIGGTALVEHSEDVHTGFDLWRAGWRLRYVPVPVATGLCPGDPDSFLTQQYRWCAGSMSLLVSRKFWTTRLPLGMRASYLSGCFYYIHTAVFAVITPAIPLILIVQYPYRVQLVNYLWIFPSMLYVLVIFPLWNRIRYGPTALMARYLYGWAHLFAITDLLRGHKKAWQVTGGRGAKASTLRIWWAMGIWGFATSALWIGGVGVRMGQYAVRSWLFLGATGLLYFGILAMAMWSRRQEPSFETVEDV